MVDSPARTPDEERMGALLSELREPPSAWIAAAKQLPAARGEIEVMVARAAKDSEYRASVLADLEAALRSEGRSPEPNLVAALRAGIAAADAD
jgi:hypothetical protein